MLNEDVGVFTEEIEETKGNESMAKHGTAISND